MTGPRFFAPITTPTGASFNLHGGVRPPPSHPRPQPDPASRGVHPMHQAPQLPSSTQSAPPIQAARPSSTVPTLIVTNPTPTPTPSAASSPPPPDYPTSSPPKYAPIPLSSERALLLAPPPSFYDPSYCPHCLEQSSPCSRCGSRGGNADWVVRLLVVLNVVVWSAVIWGYINEWNDPDTAYPGCVGMGVGYGGYYPGCTDDPMVNIARTCLGEWSD